MRRECKLDEQTWATITNYYRLSLLFGVLLSAVVFGFVTMINLTIIGIIYLGVGIFLFSFFIINKGKIYYKVMWLMLSGVLVSLYLQMGFILSAFSRLVLILDLWSLFFLATIYLILLAYSYRRLFSMYQRGWEFHEKHNESRVLNLIDHTYNVKANFKLKNNKHGRLDRILNIFFIHIGPFIFVASFVLRKKGIEALDSAIYSGLALIVGLGMSYLFMAALFLFRKIRYYEKKIGTEIYNK